MKYAKIRGQATLELAVSFICVFILIFGALSVFVWVNKRLIHQQEDYEETRVTAGADSPGQEVDYTNEGRYPKLDIFSEIK